MERDTGLPKRPNYFFALLPDRAAMASADRMAKALHGLLGLSDAPRGSRKYHVSLWGWPAGHAPDTEELALMHRAAQRVEQAPFRLVFDEVATFGQGLEKPALVVTGDDGVIGADRLRDAIEQGMRAGGFRGRRSAGRPHLTLLYDRFRTKPFRVRPLSWRVSEFVLIRSVRKQPYDILGRWPLQS